MYAQGTRYLVDVDETYVPLASLDSAYVGSVEVAGESQALLRKTLFLAKAPQSEAKLLLNPFLALAVHRGAISTLLMQISPRTPSIAALLGCYSGKEAERGDTASVLVETYPSRSAMRSKG